MAKITTIRKTGSIFMLVGLLGGIVMAFWGRWLQGVLPMIGLILGGYLLVDKADREYRRQFYQGAVRGREENRLAKRKRRQMLLDEAVSKGDLTLVKEAYAYEVTGGVHDILPSDSQTSFTETVKIALLKIAAVHGAEPLLQALASEDWDFHKAPVIAALGELKEPRAIDLLMRVRLRSSTEWPEVKKALIAMGELVVEPMISILRDRHVSEHNIGTAIDILGEIGVKRAIDLIIPHTTSAYPSICLSAAIALGKMRAQESVPYLIKMLGRFEPHDSRIIVEAIANIGDSTAIEPIERAMAKISPNYDPIVRNTFQNALDKLRSSSTEGNRSATDTKQAEKTN
jgi:HEAT repeat protein